MESTKQHRTWPMKNYTDARLAFSLRSDTIKTQLQYYCVSYRWRKKVERDRQPLLCRNGPWKRCILSCYMGPQRFEEKHICRLIHKQKATILVLIVCLKKKKIHVVKYIMISPIVHKTQLLTLVSNQ